MKKGFSPISFVDYKSEEKDEKIIRPISFVGTETDEDCKFNEIIKEREDKEGNLETQNIIRSTCCDKKVLQTNQMKVQLVRGNSFEINRTENNDNTVQHNNIIEPIVILKKSERFTRNNNGDLCIVYNNSIIPVCNFIVIPVNEIIVYNGYNTTKKYIIKGIVNGNENLPSITIIASEFKNSDWIYRKWGLKCKLYAIDKAYELIQEYICEQMDNVKIKFEYNYIGWQFINGRYVYLHGEGAIGSNTLNLHGNREYALKINSQLSEQQAFTWLIDTLNIASYNISIPLLAYTILSILNTPFKNAGFEPKFVLFLSGNTGSRKTTLAKMFSNIFNRNVNFVPASFKDTIASLEVKAYEYRDSILIVDDYHPTISGIEKNNMNTIAQYLMRIYGDKISKSRMNKYMQKQKEFKPNGLCLITGEDTIGGSSTTARYIGLEIKKDDVNLRKLTEHQQDMTVHSTALANFINSVANSYNLTVNYIRTEFLRLREENQNKFGHGRLVESYISLKIAFELLLIYGERINMLDSKGRKNWSDTANRVFLQVLQTHDESMIHQDPGMMYLIAIEELIISGKVTICEKNSVNKNNKNILGYKDEDRIYLIPNTAYNEVVQFWKKQNKNFPLSYRKTNESLENLGVLDIRYESDKKVRTVKIAIGGKRDRYLVLDINKVKHIISNIS